MWLACNTPVHILRGNVIKRKFCISICQGKNVFDTLCSLICQECATKASNRVKSFVGTIWLESDNNSKC